MKVWYVDDILYGVDEVDVADDFDFTGRYDLWPTEDLAKVELKKRIKADIKYLQELLEDL